MTTTTTTTTTDDDDDADGDDGDNGMNECVSVAFLNLSLYPQSNAGV